MRVFAFLVIVLGLAAPLSAQDAPRLVKLVSVTAADNAITRQFFGHVAAKETVDLAFQVGGQIMKFPVIEGEPLGKGAMVAQLDLELFQLTLDQARVQRDQADRTVARLEKLRGRAASDVSIDDAKTQAQLAEIAVRNAERSLRDATLAAPFDALVATRNVAKFASISAGTPVVRLHDMSELRVEIDVPEILFQRAGRDPDIELWAQFPASDGRYPLEVREFNAETSQVGQTFRITLAMSQPEDIVVLPGSSVTVFSTLRSGNSRIEIPGSAVIAGNDGTAQVMVFDPAGADEGSVKLTDISIQPTSRGTVEVTAGLEPGQEIVASGANRLSDGETVRRFTGFSN